MINTQSYPLLLPQIVLTALSIMFYLNICQHLPVAACVQGMCSGQRALMARLVDRSASIAVMHKGDPSPSTSSPPAVGSIPGHGEAQPGHLPWERN